MRYVYRLLALLIVVAVGGGAAYLTFWDIPPPNVPVEKPIPDDHFPR